MICMYVRTLKRRLVSNILTRNKRRRNARVWLPGGLQEKLMWNLLKIKYNVLVPRNMVAKLLHDFDPEASSLKKKKRLKRRHYLSYGPNQCCHIDGEYNFMIPNDLKDIHHRIFTEE